MSFFKSTKYLSIGDFVQFTEDSSFQYISTIENEQVVWLADVGRDIHVSELKPIAITQEWVDKVFTPALPSTEIGRDKNSFFISVKDKKKTINMKIDYVHQLQHILSLI